MSETRKKRTFSVEMKIEDVYDIGSYSSPEQIQEIIGRYLFLFGDMQITSFHMVPGDFND